MNSVALDLRTLDPRIVRVVDTSVPGINRMQVFFTNGWGVSIIRGMFTYGSDEGLFEMLLIVPGGDLLTEKILGWLTEEQVMNAIEAVSLFSDKVRGGDDGCMALLNTGSDCGLLLRVQSFPLDEDAKELTES